MWVGRQVRCENARVMCVFSFVCVCFASCFLFVSFVCVEYVLHFCYGGLSVGLRVRPVCSLWSIVALVLFVCWTVVCVFVCRCVFVCACLFLYLCIFVAVFVRGCLLFLCMFIMCIGCHC